MEIEHDPRSDQRALMIISDRLADPELERFFTHNAHRRAATRALLELLGVPLPSWAQRHVNGRSAATKAALARYRADNPDENLPRGYVPPRGR